MTDLEKAEARIKYLERMVDRVPIREHYFIQRDLAMARRSRDELLRFEAVKQALVSGVEAVVI